MKVELNAHLRKLTADVSMVLTNGCSLRRIHSAELWQNELFFCVNVSKQSLLKCVPRGLAGGPVSPVDLFEQSIEDSIKLSVVCKKPATDWSRPISVWFHY